MALGEEGWGTAQEGEREGDREAMVTLLDSCGD